MRWNKREPRRERRLQEQRTIKRFLLFPRCINDETRWLEIANIIQSWSGLSWVDAHWED